MRASLRARPRQGGLLLLALAAGAALPATAAAKPAVKIAKLGSPPRATVETGSTFRLAAKLKNRSEKATVPKVTVRLHSTRSAKGRTVASRRLAKLKAG